MVQTDASRLRAWVTPGNHNFLRVSRILRSLALLGLRDEVGRPSSPCWSGLRRGRPGAPSAPSRCTIGARPRAPPDGGVLHGRHAFRRRRRARAVPPPVRVGRGDGCGDGGALERDRRRGGRGLASRRLRAEADAGRRWRRCSMRCMAASAWSPATTTAPRRARCRAGRRCRTTPRSMLDGTRLVLCHYALRTWRDMGRGAVNLHGHSHGRLAPMTRQYDVGVDARDFRPVTLAGLRAGRRGRDCSGDSSSLADRTGSCDASRRWPRVHKRERCRTVQVAGLGGRAHNASAQLTPNHAVAPSKDGVRCGHLAVWIFGEPKPPAEACRSSRAIARQRISRLRRANGMFSASSGMCNRLPHLRPARSRTDAGCCAEAQTTAGHGNRRHRQLGCRVTETCEAKLAVAWIRS